ncbi:MAG: zf-HC2 domain-containing protein [FCB group bacterium]|nr:zf-HC2 domain-containing protein [FCB group bacterium]
MRCRKVRSYLSAYCDDELNERRRLAISEHLSTCASCRKEEAMYRSINNVRLELRELKVSKDFNKILFNRLAQERFAETRSQAYLPKRAPLISWKKAIPVFVSACLLILVTISVWMPSSRKNILQFATNTHSLDDSYLTAQPVSNPNLTVKLNHNWSFDNQLAKVKRVNRITNTITRPGGFDWNGYGTGLTRVSSHQNNFVPYSFDYYRMRPVIKVYVLPTTSVRKEAMETY